MKIFKLFVFAFLLLFLSASVYADVVDRIVAVVNDEVITLAELDHEFEPYAKNINESYKGPDKDDVIRKNKNALLRQMIDQILIEQTAKKAGGIAAIKDEEVTSILNEMLAKNKTTMGDYVKKLAAEGSSLDHVRKEIKSQMLRMRLLRREVQSKIIVTDEEIGAYYDQHRDDYEGKEASHIKQIFLPVSESDPGTVRAQTKKLATELRDRISKGDSFEMLAVQYSKGPTAAQGGDIGFVEKGVIVPEVEKAAFSLPVGKLSEVIETEQGYHLIVVIDKQGAGLKPIATVRSEVKAKIEEEKISKKFEEWMEDLRKKSFIDIRYQ